MSAKEPPNFVGLLTFLSLFGITTPGMVAKLDSNGGTVDCTLAMDQGHCVGSKSGEDYWTAQDLGLGEINSNN